MNKIAILYICTGRYSVYWKKFYKYVEKNLLPNSDKHYFIFTDNKKILASKNKNIHAYYQQVEQWPFPTLKRFEYFLKAKEELLGYDFVIFMNGNLIVKKTISEEEFLPQNKQKLFVTLHPGFYNKKPSEFTYDRNPDCSAYIEEGKGYCYFAGGLNGGIANEFIKMCEILYTNINTDLKENIIPIWHDESQINKYMLEYNDDYKILSPAYLYPENWNIPFEKKIIVLDKKKKGGHNFLRGLK